MVTTTTNDDDMPTHDAHGTDLGRVRTMLDAGFSESLMAEVLGTTVNLIRQAVIVATGDMQGSPTPDEIWGPLTAEIQSGWTPEMAAAAKRGEVRFSSSVVRDMSRHINADKVRQAQCEEKIRRRVEEGNVRVVEIGGGGKRFECRMQFCGRTASQRFDDREEAVAWGRAWLRQQYEYRQAEACSGK